MDTWPRSNKISGGFRCLGAAAHYANIRSFISTTKNMATSTARWSVSHNSGDYASQADFASCKSATKAWNEAQAWWPKGPGDPDVRVLRVVPDSPEYWDTRGNSIMVALKLTAARLSGNPPALGERTGR
jgi:hypothetical protein